MTETIPHHLLNDFPGTPDNRKPGTGGDGPMAARCGLSTRGRWDGPGTYHELEGVLCATLYEKRFHVNVLQPPNHHLRAPLEVAFCRVQNPVGTCIMLGKCACRRKVCLPKPQLKSMLSWTANSACKFKVQTSYFTYFAFNT